MSTTILNWCYSLTADYDRLAQFFTGTIEDGMRQQLEERLNEGVDGSRFEEVFSDYKGRFEEVERELSEKLEEAEIAGVPEWLVVEKEAFDLSPLFEPPVPTQEFLASGERMVASAGIGAVGGVVVGKVTSEALGEAVLRQDHDAPCERFGEKGAHKRRSLCCGHACGARSGDSCRSRYRGSVRLSASEGR